LSIIYGDRESRLLLPASIEEYVGESDPVRVYDAFIDSINFEELEIKVKVEENQVGAPPYDPRAMLKLLVYGYSYGIRGSRKLERACYHNLSFVWLVGGLKPDFRTIARFRTNNKKALKKILKLCTHLCIRLKLIEGNVLFVDSSKFRANASLNQMWSEEKCRRVLERLDIRIEELLESCKQIDEEEEGLPSLVELEKELQNKEKLKKKVEGILGELRIEGEGGEGGEGVEGVEGVEDRNRNKKEKEKEKDSKKSKSLNSTDKTCVRTKGRQGIHAGYTDEMVTDGKHGLIVHNEVVSASNDSNQLSRQVQGAEEVLRKEVEAVCGDNGYWQVDDLEKISSRGTKVVVPGRKQASRKGLGEFDRENFRYDSEKDEYICPEGNRLRFKRIAKKDNAREYIIKDKEICFKCKHYGQCTKSKVGRRLQRLINEEVKEELEAIYDSPEGQKIYQLRKEKAELPFGHIKRNLGAGYFLLRGIDGVNAEMSMLSTCFNISRMITLVGVSEPLRYFAGI
jgi:transposase